ncbi:chromodomain-helicase-DNA-binding protein 4 [Apostasia shenzhenica]|uniref:Chromodomain-helicase-DNA-binding protein 4 n=1 Tax=Apostasia shenzhenica TaxID=1088818 RepID=A0A2I0BGH5_9ASPA|nr:chromodomain-helicase-DNA-binding protein 4 [Apostasia shenzhenica]
MVSTFGLAETVPSYLHVDSGYCSYGTERKSVKEWTSSFTSHDFNYWKPVELEGEYWHDALKTLHVNPRNFKSEKIKWRKHLISIGWKIESKRDAMIRFRYISPDGITYYSLITACQHLLKDEVDKKKTLHEIVPSKAEPSLLQSVNSEILGVTTRLKPHPYSSGLLNSNRTSATSSKDIGENAHIAGSSVKYLDSKEVLGNEDSQVIAAYMEHINKPKDCKKLSCSDIRVLRSKVKDYLLKKGWKIWLTDKKERKELRYTSPIGKTYISLYTACKGYLEVLIPNTFCHLSDSIRPLCLDLTTLDHMRSLEQQQVGFEKGFSHPSRAYNSVDISSNKQNVDESQCMKRRKTKSLLSTLISDRQPLTYLDTNCCIAGKDSRATSNKPLGKVLLSSSQCSGKRARQIMDISIKPQAAKTVLSWLIGKGGVLPRDKVIYIRKRDCRIMKEGCIYHDGIRCRCCQEVFTLSEFEAHAGEKTCSPFSSVILRDGRSLLDCLKQMICDFRPKEFQHARLKGNYSDFETDYVCTVCLDGGTLLLCDLCPSAFHPTCVGLECVPEGNWFCPSCRCGICGVSEFNCDTEHVSENSGIYCDQCERQCMSLFQFDSFI